MTMLRTLIGLMGGVLHVPVALADTIPAPSGEICDPLLVNCGGGASNVLAANFPEVLIWILNFASALAVFFIVWSGFNMVIALGDEGKISKSRWGVVYALLGLFIAISSQVIVAFVGTMNMGEAGSPAAVVINVGGAAIASLRILLNASFVIVIVTAGIRMVYAQGKSDEFNKGRTTIVWAIVGAVIMNLAAAIIRAFLSAANLV